MTIVADRPRMVDVTVVANAWSGTDIASSLTAIIGIDDEARRALARSIMDSAASDTLDGDEDGVMGRAVLHHLRSTLGDRVPVRGYIDGERVRVGGRSFTLTGEVCPECESSPTSYGPGGGEECVNESGCGWKVCW